MANLNLPNVREGGDIRFRIGLEDNGVAVDWSGLEGIRVFLYADAQKQVSGECTIEVDAEDNTVLACLYSGDDPQFRGINSVLVRAKYQGEIKVYDKPAINIVARTADADGVLVIDDPVVPVQINVEEVSTSLLNNAIDAAINAAAGAEKAIEDVRDEETAIQAAEAARVLAEQGRVSAEQSRVAQASADHTLAGQDHTRAESDHGTASDDHTLAVSDHGVASGDHTTALVDHSLAESDHTRAESDHGVAGSDHTIAQGDHTQAGSDHSTAVADHTQAGADHTVAGQDHTQAGTDHNTAASDHTQAGLDHTQAGEDHTQALADHQVMAGYDDRLDAVEGEVDQLEAKVDELDEGIGGNYSPGYYKNDGSIGASKEWFKADDFIPVEPGSLVWNPGEVGTSPVMLRFDENKQQIDSAYNASATERTITITSQVRYVKPSFAYSNLANAKIVNNGKTIWTPRLGTGEIDYRFLQDVNAFIDGNNVWKSGTVKCCFLPVTPGQSIFISAGENPAFLAVLKDTVSITNTTPHFADTIPGRFLATQGQIITIPDDGQYLYISLSASSMPTDTRFFSVPELPREKITESNIHLEKEVGLLKKSIDDVGGNLQSSIDDISGKLDYKDVSLVSGGGINKNTGGTTTGSTSRTDYLPITEGYGIFVKGIIATLVTPLALYDANKVFIEAELNSGECFRSADYLKTVGAKYFRCTIGADQVSSGDWYIVHTKKVPQPLNPVANQLAKLSDVVSTIPDAVEPKSSIRLLDAIGNPLNPLSYQTDESGNEIPSTREVLNVQKKAKQLSDIEWTPLASVPNNNGTFPANVKVKGIPYTSVKECDKYVGWDVSIHTFMTAVNNPYSLLYTENVSADGSQSAWGKTYHGTNCSAYFGTVCNEFAKYSAGCDVDFETAFDKWLHEHRLTFAKVFDQSAQGVRIGDIWWQSGHNRIITGIKRNEDGDVTNVVVSEAVNIKVIVTEMTASAFDALIASQHAIIYRSIELYMNRYTPSPYIPLGDEDATPVTYNDDICTFAGDRATFREGDTIIIDYNLKSVGAWTEMELYKNDELVDTITIDTSAHYVNLTSRNLAYGKYKARMKNGSNYSDFTYWEILQTTVSHAFVAGKSSVTFSSNNGKPWYYILGTQAGNRTVMNSLTDDELSAGKVVVDFNAMQKQQRYNNEDLTGTYYLKVKFRGDYGCVTNDPIPVVF